MNPVPITPNSISIAIGKTSRLILSCGFLFLTACASSRSAPDNIVAFTSDGRPTLTKIETTTQVAPDTSDDGMASRTPPNPVGIPRQDAPTAPTLGPNASDAPFPTNMSPPPTPGHAEYSRVAGPSLQPSRDHALLPTASPTDAPPARPDAPPARPDAPPARPDAPPARLYRLTDGGCCVAPFWSPDSQWVLFIDKPTADAPTGIYRVSVEPGGDNTRIVPTPPELWSERIAFYTRELDFAINPEPTGTRLTRLSDGREFRIRNGGRQVLLAPDRTRVVWVETRETFPIENRVSNVMLSNLDGSNPQRIMQLLRGNVIAWLDDNRLLMSGRLSRDTNDTTVFVYDLRNTSARTDLVSAERIRLVTPSRGGSWIAYAIVNDRDASRNGLWVVRTDGTGRKKLEAFGAVQWRDDSRLIYVPLEMGVTTHAFFEYDAETGETRRLTPPDQPFKIAGGDWAISPDGTKIVFVNAADNNLWVWYNLR